MYIICIAYSINQRFYTILSYAVINGGLLHGSFLSSLSGSHPRDFGHFRLEADDGILFADGECCEGWIVYFSFVFFFGLRLRPDKRRVVYQTAICACFLFFRMNICCCILILLPLLNTQHQRKNHQFRTCTIRSLSAWDFEFTSNQIFFKIDITYLESTSTTC